MSWAAIGVSVVGAGVSVYEGSQNRKAAQKSGSQKQLERLLANNVQKTSPMGMQWLGDFNSDIGAGEDFWKSLALGDRSKMMSALGPDLTTANQGAADALGRDFTLAPRGSGSPERRLGLLDSNFARSNNALLSLRPTAFSQLSQLGALRGQTAQGLLGYGANSTINLGNLGLNRNAQNFDQERASAAGLMSIFQYLQSSGAFNRKNGTTGIGTTRDNGATAADFLRDSGGYY
jgi:hypothetical protein